MTEILRSFDVPSVVFGMLVLAGILFALDRKRQEDHQTLERKVDAMMVQQGLEPHDYEPQGRPVAKPKPRRRNDLERGTIR